MDVCVKILQMLDGSSGFFLQVEKVAVSQRNVSYMTARAGECAYAFTLEERVKLGHGRHAAGDL